VKLDNPEEGKHIFHSIQSMAEFIAAHKVK
jgi:hypothetical protein